MHFASILYSMVVTDGDRAVHLRVVTLSLLLVERASRASRAEASRASRAEASRDSRAEASFKGFEGGGFEARGTRVEAA
tara:strand:- start:447 stop:683 length:237 start_codon:yes stop_codon:yes gene_type:complete